MIWADADSSTNAAGWWYAGDRSDLPATPPKGQLEIAARKMPRLRTLAADAMDKQAASGQLRSQSREIPTLDGWVVTPRSMLVARRRLQAIDLRDQVRAGTEE